MPTQVFRYFDEEDHAQRLLKGYVWLSTLDWCRTCDEARADPSEAKMTIGHDGIHGLDPSPAAARLRELARPFIGDISGANAFIHPVIQFSYSHPNAVLFCTSLSEPNEYLRRQFGKYCVRIRLPEIFCQRLNNVLARTLDAPNYAMGSLQYRGRLLNGSREEMLHPAFLGPAENHRENEFRMMWDLPKGKEIDRHEILVPGIARLCSLVA